MKKVINLRTFVNDVRNDLLQNDNDFRFINVVNRIFNSDNVPNRDLLITDLENNLDESLSIGLIYKMLVEYTENDVVKELGLSFEGYEYSLEQYIRDSVSEYFNELELNIILYLNDNILYKGDYIFESIYNKEVIDLLSDSGINDIVKEVKNAVTLSDYRTDLGVYNELMSKVNIINGPILTNLDIFSDLSINNKYKIITHKVGTIESGILFYINEGNKVKDIIGNECLYYIEYKLNII